VNLHRVVIFRGDDVPDLPLSNYEAIHPEQLWEWLETAGGGPGNVVAITHNADASGGAMFNPRYSDGRELDAEYARRRALWEPLTEVHQIKGNSETSPAVSPGDDFAGFEQLETNVKLGEMSFGTAAGQRVWSTVRGGLQEGLRQQAAGGACFSLSGCVDSSAGSDTGPCRRFPPVRRTRFGGLSGTGRSTRTSI
jgi:Protein of unknown function (DUF3604)